MKTSQGIARYALLLLAFLAFTWALHTASGVTFVGVENLRFTRHKLEAGFIPAWRWHRALGNLYTLSVAASATSGFPLAMTVTGGIVAAVGFIVLDFLWVTTTISFYAARSRQFGRHASWLIRSYSLTLANTTLHLALPLLTASLGDRTSAYRIAIWLALMVNLELAELFVRRMHTRAQKRCPSIVTALDHRGVFAYRS